AVRPRVAYSHGSYADQFLRYVRARAEQVALPRVWVVGADMVSSAAREVAGELGCILYSTYSAVEAGRLGFQCEHLDGYHLNVDACAVRIVDRGGRSVPPGQTGEIVISNLSNRATVLLNFAVGDRGALDPTPCKCGRSLPLLARL